MSDLFQLVGKTVEGPVEIERVVGEGGFGVVYRGQHLSFCEPAAVKVLKLPGSLDDKQRATFLKKFQLEARILYKLSKQTLNVVRPIFFGSLDDTPVGFAPYCVMEWLEGSGLEEELAKRQQRIRTGEITAGRSIGELVGVIAPLVDALDHAHRLGVIHRDIKPANVFVLPEGQKPRIKLLDFGIAKLVDLGGNVAGTTTMSAGTLLALTPEYAAPEQWDYELGDVGPQTDVYALAMMLLELMLDRHPLAGLSNSQRMFTACNPQQRPGPRKYTLDVSDEVEELFAQALACKPEDRAGSVKAWWHALERAAAGSGAVPGASANAEIGETECGPEGGGAANAAVAPTLLQNVAAVPVTVATQQPPATTPLTMASSPQTADLAGPLPSTNVAPATAAAETPRLHRSPARGIWIGAALLAIGGVAVAMWAASRSRDQTASTGGSGGSASVVSNRAAEASTDGGAAKGADGGAATAAGKGAVDGAQASTSPDAAVTASAGATVHDKKTSTSSAGKARATRVLVGRPVVRGSLAPRVIRRFVRRHVNEVRNCYTRKLGNNPRSGRVVIQFTVAGAGQVVASRVQSSTLGMPVVESCIAKRVRRWRFPGPKGGGIVMVSYPFVLRASGRSKTTRKTVVNRTTEASKPTNSTSLGSLQRQAGTAYVRGQLGRATQLARAVLKRNPGDQKMLLLLGASGCKLSRLSQARRAYRRMKSGAARKRLQSICAQTGVALLRR